MNFRHCRKWTKNDWFRIHAFDCNKPAAVPYIAELNASYIGQAAKSAVWKYQVDLLAVSIRLGNCYCYCIYLLVYLLLKKQFPSPIIHVTHKTINLNWSLISKCQMHCAWHICSSFSVLFFNIQFIFWKK